MSDETQNKILLVDDDVLVTKSFELLSKRCTDYDVYTFNSPLLALEFIRDNDIDLIISDVVMPEMNGVDFLAQVKKIKPSITLILLTGYADKESAIKAINEVGIYKYIEKPWGNDDMLLTIKNALERNKLIETIRMQKEIERLRNDFIATLTHDLRTPLLAAIQTLEFFLDGTLGEITEQQNKFLETMLHSNQDMLGLVNALLEVYRYESGNYILNKDNFDLSELTHRCIQEVEPLLKKKNINLIAGFKDNIVVFGDKQEIRRVVANFIGNSIIHTKPDGDVVVEIEEKDKETIFSVQDNGGGIPEEDAKKLFNRFSQGTSKKRSTGTGLGLYLSRQIIEAHEGQIGLETELNKGSKFYFKLKK